MRALECSLLASGAMVPIGPILVGVDFSATSRVALEVAGEMSRRLDAEVVLLHVDAEPELAPLSAGAAARRAQARLAMAQLRQDLEDMGVPARTLLRPGDPAREILRIAADETSAVIVMGRSGQPRAAAQSLGSVADQVMRHARQPVLVVPESCRRTRLHDGCLCGG